MANKPTMLMFVYNDLTTDSRVQRSIDTLMTSFDITVLSTGEPYKPNAINNILLKSTKAGMSRYFDIVRQVVNYGKTHEFQYLYLHDYYSCLIGLKLYKHHTLIYDAHELIINTKTYPVGKRERFFGFFEKRLVSKAHLVISADKKRSELMKEHYKLERMPFVVPNYSELPITDDYQLTNELKSFFQDSRKTFVYAGALVQGRHIESILSGAAKLSYDYKVLIIGDGTDRNNLEHIAMLHPNLKSLFTGSIPYKYLGMILQLCDVGFLSYPMTDLNNIYCAPNKIYEYASVDLPMICNDNPNLISIVGRNGIGVCVSEKDAFGCVSSIEEALAMIDRDYEKYKYNIQEFRHKNSWNTISNNYLKKIQSI